MPSPDDRRENLVQLSDDGLQMIREAAAVPVNNEQQLITGRTAEETDALRQILSKWPQTFENLVENYTVQAIKWGTSYYG